MNRREFERVIERKLRNARETHQQHALLYIDVDRLQEINETCGHHAGDELLRQVAATMLAKLRRSDVLARAGGDEFAVLMPNCPLHRARQIAQTLLDSRSPRRFQLAGAHVQRGVEHRRGVDRSVRPGCGGAARGRGGGEHAGQGRRRRPGACVPGRRHRHACPQRRGRLGDPHRLGTGPRSVSPVRAAGGPHR